MIDKFGQTTDLATEVMLAQACTEGPDAVNDFMPVIRLVEKAGLTHPRRALLPPAASGRDPR